MLIKENTETDDGYIDGLTELTGASEVYTINRVIERSGYSFFLDSLQANLAMG